MAKASLSIYEYYFSVFVKVLDIKAIGCSDPSSIVCEITAPQGDASVATITGLCMSKCIKISHVVIKPFDLLKTFVHIHSTSLLKFF